jgi:hypothetical protein
MKMQNNQLNEIPRQFQFRLLTLLIIVSVLGWLIGWGVSSYVSFCNDINEGIPNAYSICLATDMVIDYLERNNGIWPKSWNDLHKSYIRAKNGYAQSFEELKKRVKIDWQVNPAKLAIVELPTNQDVPPFRVIWLVDGRRDYLKFAEPNRRILEYLKQSKIASVSESGNQSQNDQSQNDVIRKLQH